MASETPTLTPRECRCGHCGNVAYLRVLTTCKTSKDRNHEIFGVPLRQGHLWQVASCPACSNINFVRTEWYEYEGSEHDYAPVDPWDPSLTNDPDAVISRPLESTEPGPPVWEAWMPPEVLFPAPFQNLPGLPPTVAHKYSAALEVRSRDGNGFGALIGRVLDELCSEQGASGHTLEKRLEKMKGEEPEPPKLPERLWRMADQARRLRNIATHQKRGNLTPEDADTILFLTHAVLQYIYVFPDIIRRIDERLVQKG